jgi:hypothetical protein
MKDLLLMRVFYFEMEVGSEDAKRFTSSITGITYWCDLELRKRYG